MSVDTLNKFLVTKHGGAVTIVIAGKVACISPEEALTLAAWLVAIAGDRETFDAVYDAVCAT